MTADQINARLATAYRAYESLTLALRPRPADTDLRNALWHAYRIAELHIING